MGRMKKKNAYLFIDGANLYAGQYKLFGLDKYLDFYEFIRQIELKFKVKFDKIVLCLLFAKTKTNNREAKVIFKK